MPRAVMVPSAMIKLSSYMCSNCVNMVLPQKKCFIHTMNMAHATIPILLTSLRYFVSLFVLLAPLSASSQNMSLKDLSVSMVQWLYSTSECTVTFSASSDSGSLMPYCATCISRMRLSWIFVSLIVQHEKYIFHTNHEVPCFYFFPPIRLSLDYLPDSFGRCSSHTPRTNS